MKIKLEKPGIAQVFVDTGEGFSQEQSLSLSVTDSKVDQTLEFDLTPFVDIRAIRIDPSNNDGIIEISKLEFKQSGHWFSQSILKPEYAQSNDIRTDWKAGRHRLFIYPTKGTNDPYFLTELDLGELSQGSNVGKRIGFHLLVLIGGLLFAWITSQIWISGLVHLINFVRLLFVSIRWLIEQYTFWIDRFSMKWEMVNPTSCAVASVIITALITYLSWDSPLFKNRSERLGTKAVYELAEGSSHSVNFFYSTDKGLAVDQSRFVHFDPDGMPFEVRILFPKITEIVTRLRIDPLESEGKVTLRNLHFVTYSGMEIPINMSRWSANKVSKILNEGEHFMTVESSGEDPYVVSPEMQVDLRTPATVPVFIGFPIVMWFFITLAFLTYNRILTEGLSVQKIRMLQRQ
jgi:hypothetical protein